MADLNTTPEQVFDWLESLCLKVDEQVKAGDLLLLNKLARNPGVKHYFDNVHKLHSVSAQVWTQYYPGMFSEARDAYEAYQREEGYAAMGQTVKTLEGQMAELQTQLATLLENQPSAKKRTPKTTTEDEPADAAAE